MRANVYVRRHFGTRKILRAIFKDLPPAQLCEGNVSCTVDVKCEWKRRFSSAALTKEISTSGWVGGLVSHTLQGCVVVGFPGGSNIGVDGWYPHPMSPHG